MCYSAMIQADYDKFCRHHGAIMSLEDFAMNVWAEPDRSRKRTTRRRMPKAMEDWFLRPQRDGLGQEIGQAIREERAEEVAQWAKDLAAQQERKAINEAKLATKPTKTAAEEVRKAGNKIVQIQRWIADAERVQLRGRDFRFFPQWWVPVLVMEEGQLTLKPMRYQLRKAGLPASSDWIEGKAQAGGKKRSACSPGPDRQHGDDQQRDDAQNPAPHVPGAGEKAKGDPWVEPEAKRDEGCQIDHVLKVPAGHGLGGLVHNNDRHGEADSHRADVQHPGASALREHHDRAFSC